MGYLRERWTEDEVLNLPAGEHDFFDRKSGQLLDKQNWREDLAKSLSAFANSGGGHIILGQADDCTIDGVPPQHERTPVADWLEQIIPNLLVYPLKSFRVHVVERRSEDSAIPTGKALVVIDVGDSLLAPHQSAVPKGRPTYYYRAGSHCLIAPHHYLEALRTRFVGAQLSMNCVGIHDIQVLRVANHAHWMSDLVAEIAIEFTIENTSRQACHTWAIDWDLYHRPEHLMILEPGQFPGRYPSLRDTQDETILPTRTITKAVSFGVPLSANALPGPLAFRLETMGIRYRAISEHFVPEYMGGPIAAVVNRSQFATLLDDAYGRFIDS